MVMKASVIIPTKNGGERYRRVLKALFENTLDGGFEVIVIDSGSGDRTVAITREFPARLYEIRPREFSHGGTRNLGAGLAKGAFLVFLTQDAIPSSPGWLEALLRPFSDDPLIAGVYSRQVPDGKNPMESFFLQQVYDDRRVVRSLGPEQRDAPSLKDIFFSNVGSVVRAEIWRHFPFDEKINMSEDQEWSKRVLRAGYKTAYEPEAKVLHSHDYTIGAVYKRNYASGRSLKGITREKFWPSLRSVASYLKAEAGYIVQNHGLRKLPHLFLYELARYGGFALGALSRGKAEKE